MRDSLGLRVRFFIASMLSMFAGSQFIHSIYRPLDGLDELVAQKEREMLADRERAMIGKDKK